MVAPSWRGVVPTPEEQVMTHSLYGLFVAWVSTAALTLAGCGEAPPDDPTVELELGTGSWRFESVTDGDEVDLVRGAQGGWHVWVAIRGRGIEDGARVRIETQPADDSESAQTVELEPAFEPEDLEGYRQFVGWPAMLADAACVVDELLRVRATLLDDEGEEVLRSERYFRVRPGDDPPSACGDAR